MEPIEPRITGAAIQANRKTLDGRGSGTFILLTA
jgi:hypothetical protein